MHEADSACTRSCAIDTLHNINILMFFSPGNSSVGLIYNSHREDIHEHGLDIIEIRPNGMLRRLLPSAATNVVVVHHNPGTILKLDESFIRTVVAQQTW